MKYDHYCIQCEDLVYIGYKLSKGNCSLDMWNNFMCPHCKSVDLLEIEIIKPEVLQKAKQKKLFKKLSRIH